MRMIRTSWGTDAWRSYLTWGEELETVMTRSHIGPACKTTTREVRTGHIRLGPRYDTPVDHRGDSSRLRSIRDLRAPFVFISNGDDRNPSNAPLNLFGFVFLDETISAAENREYTLCAVNAK